MDVTCLLIISKECEPCGMSDCNKNEGSEKNRYILSESLREEVSNFLSRVDSKNYR